MSAARGQPAAPLPVAQPAAPLPQQPAAPLPQQPAAPLPAAPLLLLMMMDLRKIGIVLMMMYRPALLLWLMMMDLYLVLVIHDLLALVLRKIGMVEMVTTAWGESPHGGGDGDGERHGGDGER